MLGSVSLCQLLSCGRTWTGLFSPEPTLSQGEILWAYMDWSRPQSPPSHPTLSRGELFLTGSKYPPISFVPLTLENEGLTMELSYPPGHLTKYCVYREARIYIQDNVNQCEQKQ